VISFLLGAAILISITSTAVVIHRKRKRRRAELESGKEVAMLPPAVEDSSDPLERPIERCRPEDIVMLDGRDWLVEEVWKLAEGARTWRECRLSDGADEAWLLCPEREEPFLGFGRPLDLAGMEPPGQQVEADGKIFTMDREGAALMDGGPQQVRFWDFQHPGAARLWHRKGLGGGRTYLGQRVPRHQITFLPGS